jgi:hypothetical protein
MRTTPDGCPAPDEQDPSSRQLRDREGDELVADGETKGVFLEYWAWSDMRHGMPTEVCTFHAFAVPFPDTDHWRTIYRSDRSLRALLANGGHWRDPPYRPSDEPDWLADYIGGPPMLTE